MGLWSRIERRITDFADDVLLDDVRDQVAEARALLAKGEAFAAIDSLEALVRERPDHGQAQITLGLARLAVDQLSDARFALEAGLRLRPGDPLALVGMGQALVRSGNYAEATPLLARAVLEAAGQRALLADAYHAAGIAWRRQGDLDKAIRELRKAAAEAPTDAEVRAALAEALWAAEIRHRDRHVTSGSAGADEVRQQLARAIELEPVPPAAELVRGQLAILEGAPLVAIGYLTRARAILASDPTPDGKWQQGDILQALGDAHLAAGDAAQATQHYFEALALDPKRALLHARIAAAHQSIGNPVAAVAAYDAAFTLAAQAGVREPLPAEVEPAALAAADAAGDAVRLTAWAQARLARLPDDLAAVTALGLGLLSAGNHDGAAGMLAAPARAGEVPAMLGLARVELARGQPVAAVPIARAALRHAPGHPGARRLVAEAAAAAFALPGVEAALPAQAAALERVLASHARLAPAVADVARTVAELDQPLLVTVMGEFSSGKSSVVNAFVGEAVAPTGILPTTATINVVRYGRERAARIHGRDGQVHDLPWDTAFARLGGLSADEVRAIDRVELLLPLPALERVHIVDTPGLNSILPEHEATARAFIAKADAVVWVFTAGQGGKASERAALERIGAEGTRVLGVLNKRDQLSDGDLAEVIAFIEATLGGLVEAVVPVSARAALPAMIARRLGSPAPADDGNWAALEGALETRFFAQARAIKRAAGARKLRAVIAEARAQLTVPAHALPTTDPAIARLHAEAQRVPERQVVTERRALLEAQRGLCQRAAREVLELVRPRKLPFAQHAATTADRDYVIEVLEAGYAHALDASMARLRATLDEASAKAEVAARALGPVDGIDPGREIARVRDGAAAQELAQAGARAQAFVRGTLRGGALDSFFRHELPKLDLTEEAVTQALQRGAPDLERDVIAPLTQALATGLGALAQALATARARADDQDAEYAPTLEALETLAGRLT